MPNWPELHRGRRRLRRTHHRRGHHHPASLGATNVGGPLDRASRSRKPLSSRHGCCQQQDLRVWGKARPPFPKRADLQRS
eukprot:3180757-Rhodomonas_salina.1